jgi:N-acetylmuramoyl-L-alanine amidase
MVQFSLPSFLVASTIGLTGVSVALAQQPLYLAYPPDNHKTTADRIFLIGTAASEGEVLVNGERIDRSQAGHFAPSLPLQVGPNVFTLQYQNQTLKVTVTRIATTPQLPQGLAFLPDSLTPNLDLARLPAEWICFGAVAPPQATVNVQLGTQILNLQEQQQITTLPGNAAVLLKDNAPQQQPGTGQYQGCSQFAQPLTLHPEFDLSLGGQTLHQTGPGTIEILDPRQITIAAVTVPSGTARTGPSTDYSRLTPLPQGTQARVTGREGEWLRLDYGAWIKASETRQFSSSTLPKTVIHSVLSREVPGWTEVVFPLQVPVPVTLSQDTTQLTLTLHNTTAQTDTIYVSQDPVIQRLDWQQPEPSHVAYTIHFKSSQQWGYKLRYENSTLILSLKHPPQNPGISAEAKARLSAPSLAGVKIFIDPGHGSSNDLGAKGPTGYPEKDVALIVSKQLRDLLQKRDATVYLSREGDDDLYPNDRVAMIEKLEPDLALSLHYNALPDDGDAIHTQGVAAFWYHPQAQDLAKFLHDYMTTTLDRPSYGVFWNNLALTRPTVAPSVLLELGFMINPEEFEWIINPQEQQKLAETIAQGVALWVDRHRSQNQVSLPNPE